MPQSIELIDGRIVPLRVIVNPRARHISLRLDSARREAVAVAPSQRLAPKAAAFAIDRAGWIQAHLARLPIAIPLTPGAVIPLRGAPHRLVMTKGRAPARIEGGASPQIVIGAPDAETFAARARRFLAAEAKRDLTAAVAMHARTLKVAWKSITVKDTTSRWGSCNSDGALCFSWRVVLAPPAILNYLAAHETAHLRELNHSKRFWAHVARCMPEFEKAEAWLRKHGASLHAVGPKTPSL
ncbi:MAG: SprT family zinc-dependent metalloprotease [Hyphomonadaceae bacterium]|nr:SprT family zinc-dependent metalloprotease [Hyphomonadaceae bacterium]